MHRHGPSCLPGPVSRVRSWWTNLHDAPAPPGDPRAPDMDSPESPAPDDRPFRADLVERVRREIAAGTYDTPEKWALALERLLRHLEEDV
jgi:hypothetical protein